MLDRISKDPRHGGSDEPSSLVTIDLPSVVGFFRRRLWIIALLTVLFGLLGIAYLEVTPKRYTATAQLLIDTRKIDLFRQQAVIEDAAINTSAVESQTQILQSEGIAKSVINHPSLKLMNTDEFAGTGPGLWKRVGLRINRLLVDAGLSQPESAETVSSDGSRVVDPGPLGNFQAWLSAYLPAWLKSDPVVPATADEKMQRAIQKFASQLEVKRIGLSYVIEIKFTSVNAARAARIANTIAAVYIDDQLQSKVEAAERASQWLQTRIKELREQASTTDRAVQNFKTENNIINAGDQLLTDQQVQELSKQRILAETNVAEAKARYDRIKIVNESGGPDASVTDVLANAVFVRLQQQYLDLVRQRNDLASRYGETHRAVQALDREAAGLRTSIRSELRRMEETYKSDYEIAQTRLTQLQTSLDKVMGTSAKALQAQVELRELESTSNSYSSLYNSFLERYVQTVQQQSFPVSEAKLITPATKPLRSSEPKTLLVLMGSLLIGGFAGCSAAAARELLDHVVRTSAQLETLSGAETLGVLPILKRHIRTKESSVAPVSVLANGLGPHLPSRMTIVLDAPFSQYAETIRSIKVTADVARLQREMKVIGIVSAMPGEGKTTVAANLAFLMAQTVGKTLLIDADLRNPSLSRSLSPHSDGLMQVLNRTGRFSDLTRIHAQSGLHFLSAGIQQKTSNTSELLRSEGMEKLLSFAREHYDYVIIDLPPLVPVVDARASAHLFDGYALVVEWGKTSADVVRRALGRSRPVHQKLIGSILNKADLQVLSRFEEIRSTYYTSNYYEEASV